MLLLFFGRCTYIMVSMISSLVMWELLKQLRYCLYICMCAHCLGHGVVFDSFFVFSFIMYAVCVSAIFNVGVL